MGCDNSVLTLRCLETYLRFDFSVYGAAFDVEEVQKLQEIVRAVIEAKFDVERKVCDIEEALVRDEVRRLEHPSIMS